MVVFHGRIRKKTHKQKQTQGLVVAKQSNPFETIAVTGNERYSNVMKTLKILIFYGSSLFDMAIFQSISFGSLQGNQPPERLSHRTIAERHFGSLPSILCDALGRVKTKRPSKKLERDRKVSFVLANLWKITLF